MTKKGQSKLMLAARLVVCTAVTAFGLYRFAHSQAKVEVAAIALTVTVLVFIAVIPIVRRTHEMRQDILKDL